jgi:2-methylcitrate dehydratase PrpD
METAELRKRVSIVADPSLDKAAATVSLHTRDGVRTARREPRIEMSDAELEAKFRSLAGADAERLMRLVGSLEALDEVSLP